MIFMNPQTTSKPAEAIRVATGIAVWDQIQVSLYLHDSAVRLFDGEFLADLNNTDYDGTPELLNEFPGPIYVHLLPEHEINTSFLPNGVNQISCSGLISLISRQQTVFRF